MHTAKVRFLPQGQGVRQYLRLSRACLIHLIKVFEKNEVLLSLFSIASFRWTFPLGFGHIGLALLLIKRHSKVGQEHKQQEHRCYYGDWLVEIDRNYPAASQTKYKRVNAVG